MNVASLENSDLMRRGVRDTEDVVLPNALVQLQAQYNHCGEAASEKCLSAATFVRLQGLGARRAAPRTDCN